MWFKSYLTAPQQQLFSNEYIYLLIETYSVEFLKGLFLALDLPNCLEFTTPCLNVDDTEIFASSIDTDVLGNNINSDLENLGDWLTVNRPQLYPVRKYFLASQKHL